MKTLARFKKQATVAVALLGVVVTAKWDAWSLTSNFDRPIIAQVETQKKSADEKAPTPESTESKSRTDEDKEATGAKEKRLEDFKPSEKIEAEQAVDFPYDI